MQRKNTMKLLQINFPHSGPWGAELTAAYTDIAQEIAAVPGLKWKFWIENSREEEAGGIYLFEDEASVNAYLEMILPRMHAFGFRNISAKTFDINAPLTEITRGKL
jgi:hypothetical protein